MVLGGGVRRAQEDELGLCVGLRLIMNSVTLV